MAQRRPWEIEDDLWELIQPLLPMLERRRSWDTAQA